MACVRKRRGKYVVDWRDGAGVRRWKTFDKKTDADAHRDKVGPQARQKLTPTVPATITLEGYGARWLTLIAHSVKPRTHASYTEILRLHILPTFGKIRVCDLDRGRIKALLSEKLATGLEKRSVRNIHAVIRAVLNAALEDGLISANPAQRLGKVMKLAPSKATTQEEIKAMDREQRQRFLDTAAQVAPRYHTLFCVLAGCGLRLGEGLGLQIEDIDFHAGMIRISRALSDDDGSVSTPKAGHGRDVQMSKALAERLRMHLLKGKQEALKDGREVGPWVFITKDGTTLDAANVRRAMRQILNAAQLPAHFSPHSLRHTYASLLLSAGYSLAFVQRQLGHASIQLTADTYGKWLPMDSHGALEWLDARPAETGAEACGSKLVAVGAYAQNPQTGAVKQVVDSRLEKLVPPTRIERATRGLGNRCSIQLSYGGVDVRY